ncbi:PilZ domain-containing protein [Saccharospirillum sp.]|uniref:PilZ domain-containing protein n=1 Tax=Saccharospirillum sp. TaxID=2033801 RepID=UPI0034A08582
MPQRKHKRTKFIYRLRAHVSGKNKTFIGQLVNVNPEGMMLIVHEPQPLNTLLHLQVELPQNVMGEGSVNFEAVVRWCEPGQTKGDYGIGVYLEHVPETSRVLIEKLMTRFQEMNSEDEPDPNVRNRPTDPLFFDRK